MLILQPKGANLQALGTISWPSFWAAILLSLKRPPQPLSRPIGDSIPPPSKADEVCVSRENPISVAKRHDDGDFEWLTAKVKEYQEGGIIA